MTALGSRHMVTCVACFLLRHLPHVRTPDAWLFLVCHPFNYKVGDFQRLGLISLNVLLSLVLRSTFLISFANLGRLTNVSWHDDEHEGK